VVISAVDQTLDSPEDTPTMTFTMFSTPWCGYCHRLKGQLEREGIGFETVDIEQQPEAAETVERANGGNQTVPTLLFRDGSTLTNPSVAQVKEKLGALA
jgi:mycoredoxin